MQEVAKQEVVEISKRLASNYREIHQLIHSFFQDLEKYGFCELERKGERLIIKNSAWGTAKAADPREG